jgi:hypothetical protein
MQLSTNQLEFPEMAEYDQINMNLDVLDDKIVKMARLNNIKVTKIDDGVWELRVIRENT